MPRRIAISNLNASTLDILNTIRANASAEYQQYVPEVTKATDIPKVGEVLYGYPAFANQFINALVNRIALVRVKSATFNNDYAELKKGYLEFGETVEEVFVSIAKAREFSAEKAKDREFKRTLPDVRSAFHTMNYRVQYPVTIQDEDLRMAFMSINGVQDLIAKIVNSVYVAEQYDEFLLFKYLLIKAIAHGKTFNVNVPISQAGMTGAASAFRGMSNRLTFMSKDFNAEHVTTVTSKDDQYIFMSSDFNAKFDVEVLASAFNMEKANFMGRLKLIDDFSTFDNDRFSEIMAGSDMLDPVTNDELKITKDVCAVIVDREWFQIYDNNNKFTEDYVASGMYWNYFYNVWKTISWSPFSNIVTFINGSGNIDLPTSLTAEIASIEDYEDGKIITLLTDDAVTKTYSNLKFVQTEALTKAGVAVHPYGAYIIPTSALAGDSITVEATTLHDAPPFKYTGTIALNPLPAVGTKITLTNQ